jgi:hypothetical protein
MTTRTDVQSPTGWPTHSRGANCQRRYHASIQMQRRVWQQPEAVLDRAALQVGMPRPFPPSTALNTIPLRPHYSPNATAHKPAHTTPSHSHPSFQIIKQPRRPTSMARATTLALVAALAILLLLSSGPARAAAARTAPVDVAAAANKASANEVRHSCIHTRIYKVSVDPWPSLVQPCLIFLSMFPSEGCGRPRVRDGRRRAAAGGLPGEEDARRAHRLHLHPGQRTQLGVACLHTYMRPCL